jgi:hypothetical protein
MTQKAESRTSRRSGHVVLSFDLCPPRPSRTLNFQHRCSQPGGAIIPSVSLLSLEFGRALPLSGCNPSPAFGGHLAPFAPRLRPTVAIRKRPDRRVKPPQLPLDLSTFLFQLSDNPRSCQVCCPPRAEDVTRQSGICLITNTLSSLAPKATYFSVRASELAQTTQIPMEEPCRKD